MNKTMFRRIAMRAGAVALCSAALCTVPMLAQGGGAGGPGGGGGGGGRGMRMTPDQQVANLDKAVTLTDDQKTKILAIYTADQKKRMDMMQSGEDRSTLMPKIQAMRTDENNQIKALLTDDQKPKFDAYLASMPQGRGGGGQGGPPPAAPPQ